MRGLNSAEKVLSKQVVSKLEVEKKAVFCDTCLLKYIRTYS